MNNPTDLQEPAQFQFDMMDDPFGATSTTDIVKEQKKQEEEKKKEEMIQKQKLKTENWETTSEECDEMMIRIMTYIRNLKDDKQYCQDVKQIKAFKIVLQKRIVYSPKLDKLGYYCAISGIVQGKKEDLDKVMPKFLKTTEKYKDRIDRQIVVQMIKEGEGANA